MAHEIVMSIPPLYRNGSTFLLHPCVQAARVLENAERKYILKTLQNIVAEVPIAWRAAKTVEAMTTS